MNGMYAKPWPRCAVCGLSEPGVHTLERCRNAKAGKSLDRSTVWSSDRFPNRPDTTPEPPPPDYHGVKPTAAKRTWRDHFLWLWQCPCGATSTEQYDTTELAEAAWAEHVKEKHPEGLPS